MGIAPRQRQEQAPPYPRQVEGSSHKSHCKACDNAKSKRYYAANRERVLAKRARRTAELRESGYQVRRSWSKWRAA